jgi:hypothetical protein
VAAVALVIKGIELHFPNPSCQFTRRSKGSGSERSDDGHVHHRHVAVLRNDITATVDHHC